MRIRTIFNDLQLTRAIGAYCVEVQENLYGREDRQLVPLLSRLLELLPWLKQWHNAVNPEYGAPMGEYSEGFIEEAGNLAASDAGTYWTLEEI